MKKIIISLFTLLTVAGNAQLKVGSNPKLIQTNTNFQVESTSGQHFVVSKDSAKVGIGTTAPTNKLHVIDTINNNPLRLEGLTSGAATDSILVSNPNTGVVRRISPSVMGAATEPWYNVATNTGATANTQNIYQMGRVGIGTTNPISLLSNTASNIISSNNMGISSTSISWIHSGPGFIQAIYNPDIIGHGLNVKVRGNTSTINAFEVGQGTTATSISNSLLKVQGDGNVGIGNSSPSYKLDVAGKGRFTDTLFGTKAQFNNLASGSQSDSIVTIDANGNLLRRSSTVIASATEPWFNVATNAGATANTQNIYQMGKVGITKASPTQQLHLGNTGNITANKTYNGITDEGFSFNHYINTSAQNGNDFVRVGDIVVASPSSSSAGAGVLRFLTSTNAEQGGTITEKMRIHSNGNVGIGSSNPPFKLSIVDNVSGSAARVYIKNTSATANSLSDFLAQNDANSNFFCGIQSSTSTAGNITTGLAGTASYVKTTAGPIFVGAGVTTTGVRLDVGASSWTSQSDRRTKKNIEKLENGLSKLITLSGYTYNYIKDEQNTPRRVGLIAQEVKEVLPEAVSVDNSGILGVKYTEVTPLIIEAVKDLKNELDAKNKELIQQKILIDQLFKELQEIKSKIK